MKTTWVTIEGHGIVRPAPAPAYLLSFLDARAPKVRRKMPDAVPPNGHAIWTRPKGPRRGPELAVKSFETSLADANLVGNIYFAHYFSWQSRLIDGFFHPFLVEAYRRGQGVPSTKRVEVEHLQDAMPFDTIEVIMTLDSLSPDGLVLGFDYFRAGDNGHRAKLAFGTHELSSEGGLARALLDELTRRTRDEESK